MPRQRTPTAKAELTGAADKNPQRFRDRAQPESVGPLGDPPAFLNKREKAAWEAFRAEWGWLTFEDRAAVAGLAQMRAILEDPKEQKNAAFYTAYRLMLSEHGGTPVSRSKIYQPQGEPEDDPFAGFDGKPN